MLKVKNIDVEIFIVPLLSNEGHGGRDESVVDGLCLILDLVGLVVEGLRNGEGAVVDHGAAMAGGLSLARGDVDLASRLGRHLNADGFSSHGERDVEADSGLGALVAEGNVVAFVHAELKGAEVADL